MNNYADHPDAELVQCMRAGDHAAFTEIYRRYWKRLYALAYHRLHNREQAEDVVQDVLTGLWQRREADLVRSLGAYLATAARYAVFTHLSRSQPLAGMDALPESLQATKDETAQLRFLQQFMEEELQLLPEKCRLVFNYSRQEGLSNKEIARHLDISEKSVEKHITKALQRLRLQFRNYLHLFF